MYYLKVHDVDGERLLAACDKELLGTRLIDDIFDFQVSKQFFGENLVDEKTLLDELLNASIANLMGNKVVDIALREGFVNETCIIEVAGAKHAQIVNIV